MSSIKSLQTPRYNVAPGQEILVLTDNQGQILPKSVCWGFPPPEWMGGFSKIIINVRAESIETKPMFRESFTHHRCLIMASGFYEWKKDAKKIPYYFYLPGSPLFSMAGIYAFSTKDNYEGMAIITTTPNQMISNIHNRMPVILDETESKRWIQSDTLTSTLLSILKPYPANMMRSYPVSTQLNSPSYNGENLIKPFESSSDQSHLY